MGEPHYFDMFRIRPALRGPCNWTGFDVYSLQFDEGFHELYKELVPSANKNLMWKRIAENAQEFARWVYNCPLSVLKEVPSKVGERYMLYRDDYGTVRYLGIALVGKLEHILPSGIAFDDRSREGIHPYTAKLDLAYIAACQRIAVQYRGDIYIPAFARNVMVFYRYYLEQEI